MPDEKNIDAISNDKIFDIFQDSKNRLWIGTAGGLNLYDKTGTFKASN